MTKEEILRQFNGKSPSHRKIAPGVIQITSENQLRPTHFDSFLGLLHKTIVWWRCTPTFLYSTTFLKRVVYPANPNHSYVPMHVREFCSRFSADPSIHLFVRPSLRMSFIASLLLFRSLTSSSFPLLFFIILPFTESIHHFSVALSITCSEPGNTFQPLFFLPGPYIHYYFNLSITDPSPGKV